MWVSRVSCLMDKKGWREAGTSRCSWGFQQTGYFWKPGNTIRGQTESVTSGGCFRGDFGKDEWSVRNDLLGGTNDSPPRRYFPAAYPQSAKSFSKISKSPCTYQKVRPYWSDCPVRQEWFADRKYFLLVLNCWRRSSDPETRLGAHRSCYRRLTANWSPQRDDWVPQR